MNAHRRATIFGLGGCGKSALALEFAYRAIAKGACVLVFWVPAISRESFEIAYREIGVLLRIPGITDDNADVKQLVSNRLSSGNFGNWLMIVDNADDSTVLLGQPDDHRRLNRLSDFLPRSDSGRIVFTTRSGKAAENLTQSNVLKLDDMERPEARQLMAQHLVEKALLDDEGAVEELLVLLAHLPLAIVQAAAFINSNGVSIPEYVSLFRQPSTESELFSEHFEDPSRYREMESTIAKTWHISFDHILKQDQLAADYLSFMACIDRTNVPQSLLPLGDTPLQQLKAIGTLKGYAFITERQQTTQKKPYTGKFFDIHRLVHMASAWWLKEHGEWTTWTSKAAARLEELVSHNRHEKSDVWTPYMWTTYLPHAIYMAGSDDTLDETARLSLLYQVGRCQVRLGQYSAAETTHRQALLSRQKRVGKEHPDTLTSMGNLAQVLLLKGDSKAAESMHRQTLVMKEKVLRKEHPSTLTSMDNLASVLRRRGDYKAAEAMYRQTVAMKEKVLGKGHPSTLISMNNLALVLSSQGDNEAAEAMYRQTLATSAKVLGNEHPSTLTSMNNLALMLGNQGDYKVAEAMYRQTLATSEKVRGTKHPLTLASVYCLAHLLAERNSYDEAVDWYQRACAGYTTNLGDDHPITRACHQKYSELLEFKES